MKNYLVKLPIAGHLTFEVNAMSESEAIEKAQDMPTNEGELEYETLTKFHAGNICYCPAPWEEEAQEI